jgi:hypothetical protein
MHLSSKLFKFIASKTKVDTLLLFMCAIKKSKFDKSCDYTMRLCGCFNKLRGRFNKSLIIYEDKCVRSVLRSYNRCSKFFALTSCGCSDRISFSPLCDRVYNRQCNEIDFQVQEAKRGMRLEVHQGGVLLQKAKFQGKGG